MAKHMNEISAEEEHEFNAFQIGDQVKHPKWGVGTILFRKGSGESTKLIVIFPDEGQKKLAMKYAKLKKVQSVKPPPKKEIEIEKEEPPAEEPAEEIEVLGKPQEEEILSPADLEEQVAFGEDDDASKIEKMSEKKDEPGE